MHFVTNINDQFGLTGVGLSVVAYLCYIFTTDTKGVSSPIGTRGHAMAN